MKLFRMYFSCLQPLDRDKPKGYEAWQVRIFAYDNGGPPSPPAMFQTVEIHIYLNDINDNAPFLNMVRGNRINKVDKSENKIH